MRTLILRAVMAGLSLGIFYGPDCYDLPIAAAEEISAPASADTSGDLVFIGVRTQKTDLRSRLKRFFKNRKAETAASVRCYVRLTRCPWVVDLSLGRKIPVHTLLPEKYLVLGFENAGKEPVHLPTGNGRFIVRLTSSEDYHYEVKLEGAFKGGGNPGSSVEYGMSVDDKSVNELIGAGNIKAVTVIPEFDDSYVYELVPVSADPGTEIK